MKGPAQFGGDRFIILQEPKVHKNATNARIKVDYNEFSYHKTHKNIRAFVAK